MCGIAGVMMGLSALSGYNQYQQQQSAYEAQARSYEAQAQAAKQNQKIAEAQRSQVADTYAEKQKNLDARRRIALGQQAAEAGASGLAGTGSVLDVGAATQEAWKQDSMNLLQNQRNDAMSAWINQANYINQERQAQAAANNTRAQAKKAKLASLVNTAVSMYGSWNTYGGTGSAAKTATQQTTASSTNPYYWNKFTKYYKYGR